MRRRNLALRRGNVAVIAVTAVVCLSAVGIAAARAGDRSNEVNVTIVSDH